jgi:hypothetical protein
MARKSKKRKSKPRAGKRRGNPFAKIIDVLFKDEVTPNGSDDETAAKPRGKKDDGKTGVLTKNVKGWRVAKSLDRLLSLLNLMAQIRSMASDGAIGDKDHQNRSSDHNPWVIDGTTGVVTARDITHDPKNGCSAQAIADAIVASKDKRIKYIIWNRKICSSSVSPWRWRKYSGSNPHTKHIHISVLPEKPLYDDEADWNLTGAMVDKLTTDFGVSDVGAIELAWGKKVNKSFKAKVIEVSARIGVDPNNLMAAMAFESGRTFRPDIKNPISGATGLIQFMPKTAQSLGTTTQKLAKMSAVDQLDVVEAYFAPYVGKLHDLSDLYMAILWPRAVGKPASYVLFASPTKAYTSNKGLDANDDGSVTKVEAADRVHQHLIEGMRDEFRG